MLSRLSVGGVSGCNVVDDETDSSMSDTLSGDGEFARRGEVLRFLERIFCVILVCEKGRACAGNGFE